MQQAPIRIQPNQESGADQLGNAQFQARNVVADRRGSVLKRPGVRAFGGLTEPVFAGAVSGLHVDVFGNVWVAVSAAEGAWIYRVTPAGAVAQAGFALGPKRVQFAETQAMLVLTCGDKPYKTNLVLPELVTLGGDPPQAHHIVAHGGRLLVIGDQPDANAVHFSDIAYGSATAGHETWNGVGESGFVSADASPDFNQAMHTNTNEVFVWGSRTLQVFASDEVTAYTPVAAREIGALAPYSVTKDDQAFAWIDSHGRVTTSDGRVFNIISEPITATLNTVTDLRNGIGFRVKTGATDSLVWSFPGDQRSFAYHKTGLWSQWASRNPATQNWTTLGITAAANDHATGRTVVGMSDGRVGILDATAGDDFGVQFDAYLQTGFEDRGSSQRKQCVRLDVTLRRGLNRPITDVPRLLIQWRDDEGSWSQPLHADLGALPDREIVVRYHGLGVYRRRQWKFSFLSGDPLALVQANETFEVLE